MVVDPFADICCFSYVLCLADITSDEMDPGISFAGS
jgi:hypothetical protein